MNFLKNINNIIEQAAEKVQTAIDGGDADDEEEDVGLEDLPPRELLEVAVEQRRRIQVLKDQLEKAKAAYDALQTTKDTFRLQESQLKELQEADAEKTRHIHSLEQQLQLGQQAVGMNVDDGDVNRLQEQVSELQSLLTQNAALVKRAQDEATASHEQLQRKEMILKGLRAEMDQLKAASEHTVAESRREVERLEVALQAAQEARTAGPEHLDPASTNGRPAPAAAALQVELDGLRAELDRVSRQAAAQQAEAAAAVATAATAQQEQDEQLKAKQEDFQRLSEEWKVKEACLTTELQEAQRLAAQVETLSAESAAAGARVHQLTAELDARGAECRRAEERAARASDELAWQAQELASVKAQLENCIQQNTTASTDALHRQEVIALSQQLERLSAELESRDKALLAAQQAAQEVEEERANLRQRLWDLEQAQSICLDAEGRIASLEAALRSEQEGCRRAAEEGAELRRRLEARLASVEAELEARARQATEAVEEASSRQGEVAALQQQLATMVEELQQREGQLSAAAERERQQQAELEGFTENVRHLSQEVEFLTLEREQRPQPDEGLGEEVGQLREAKQRNEEKLIRLQGQLHAALQESDALQGQLQEKTVQLEAMQQQLAGIDAVHQQELQRAQKENKDLTFRLNAVEQKLDLALQELSEYAAKIAGMGSGRDQALQQLRQCEAGAQAKLQALEQELREAHQVALETAEVERQRQVRELEGKLYHAEGQWKSALLELKALQRVVEEQQSQLQGLQEEKAARLAEGAPPPGGSHTAAAEEVGRLQRQLEDLQGMLEERTQMQEVTESHVHELSKCIAERDGHIGDLQAQLEELEREVEQKEAYVAELRATKEALEQQMSARASEMRELRQAAARDPAPPAGGPAIDETAIRAEEEAKRQALQESLGRELADREAQLAGAQAAARQKAKEAAQAQALLAELEAKVAQLEQGGAGDKETIGRQCDSELTASLQEELRVARSKLSDVEVQLALAVQRQSLQDIDLWPAVVIAAAAFVRAVVYAWGVAKRHAILAYGLARQRYEEMRREAPPARPI